MLEALLILFKYFLNIKISNKHRIEPKIKNKKFKWEKKIIFESHLFLLKTIEEVMHQIVQQF